MTLRLTVIVASIELLSLFQVFMQNATRLEKELDTMESEIKKRSTFDRRYTENGRIACLNWDIHLNGLVTLIDSSIKLLFRI